MVMDTLYFVLGSLDESNGRMVERGDDAIERFYGNERHKAEVFRTYLEKLAEDRGRSAAIETEIDGGGRTIFRSSELALLINSCYKLVKDAGYCDEAGVSMGSRVMFASHELFGETSRLKELSFLAGAYARFGEGNTFRMANAEHKVDLVARLLSQYGCRELSVTYLPTYVPRVFVLSFEPSKEIGEIVEACV